MAGIYIHIPFCRQKCNYCDFYKIVNISLLRQFILALKTEAKIRKNYLQNETVATVYFGGGTPSLLSAVEIDGILSFLYDNFQVAGNAEITLEANPDDLSKEYLKEIKKAGINRLSIGIQSFNDEYLKLMNRRHNAKQAIEVVKQAKKYGFDNLSVDLIYGLPGLTEKEWEESLLQVFKLPVQHLSAYHLTYHEGTQFYNWLKEGRVGELNEEQSVSQFNMLADLSVANGFEHYEISNLAKNGLYSRHNTSYWQGIKYLGLGPSAHSFDGVSRQWNESDVGSYLNAIKTGTSYSEEEILTENDHFNEYILTHIRTQWGISLESVNKRFGEEKLLYLKNRLEKYMNTGTIFQQKNTVTLTRKGLFVSDEITTDLIII